MKIITIGKQQVDVYDVNEFPYWKLGKADIIHKNKKISYYNIFATFDIETTSIVHEEKDIGFMYVWQFCIDGNIIMGRTWKEFIILLVRLSNSLPDAYLCIYVHNLSYEFQFIRNFFKWDKIFATDKREVIFATTSKFEFRCSYRLTNMSLKTFTNKTPKVTFKKLDGEEFDYSVTRYSDTELTEYEYGYCISDVLGLWEGINYLLESNNDTICTIPYTSTGYVRRDYRNKCLQDKEHMKLFRNKELSARHYLLCREASRGAIAGSNHINTNETLDDVDSFDKKSSYPEQMITKYFPGSKFLLFNAETIDDKFIKQLEYKCCLIVWECKNLKLKKWNSIPYISKGKCRAIENARCGNGKVYMADRIGMVCTEIDFKIIMEDYNFTDVKIHEMYVANRKPLSKAFREHLSFMFQQKTDLDGIDVELYMKYKNKINASFGMMLTDILHPEIEYDNLSDTPWKENDITDIDSALKKYYNIPTSFLSYQDGVWVLAHAREELHKGMKIVGRDLVLVDTDSVKCLGNHKRDFELLNKEIIQRCEECDVQAYSIDKNGNKVYLGIWEHEGKGEYTYDEFRTLGSKKYCYRNGDELHITVSGLNKGAAWYLQEIGGIEMFKPGTIFPATYKGKTVSGRSALVYNDETRIQTIVHDGHTILTGSNIAFREATYTLGMADEWYMAVFRKDNFEIEAGMFKGWR